MRPIHWTAPTVMIGAFGAGLLTATGHHLFYRGLSGKLAPNENSLSILGWDVPQQQINFAAGTAFAFVTKAFLVLAVSVSYTQSVWTAAKSSDESLTITSLDAVFSVLDNLLAFVELPVWFRNPLLLLLAATAWLLPVASIITPSTLSVQLAPRDPLFSSLRYVPELDFRSLAFSAVMTVHEDNPFNPAIVSYNGPSLAVQSVVGASALEGGILPIRVPWLNASWSTSFLGPSLSCTNVTQQSRTTIQENIAHAILSSANCYSPPVYLSWFRPVSTLPYENHDFVGKPKFTVASPYTGAAYSEGPAILYISIIPSMAMSNPNAPWNPADCGYLQQHPNNKTWTSPLVPTGTDSTLIVQCQLTESAYFIEFDYVNGTQHIRTSLNTSTTVRDFVPSFEAPGVGEDYELLRQMSYQSVLEAFSDWLIGSINNGVTRGAEFVTNSNVLRTSVLQANEMAIFSPTRPNHLLELFNASYLGTFLAHGQRASGVLDLSKKIETTNRRPLVNIVEELFQNVTISLMSAEELQPNMSSSLAPPPRNVTFTAYRNIYVYSATKLWLAYGLASAFSALAVLVGLFAIWNNGASYSNEYSTLLRTTLGAELSKDIFKKDMDGRDPLPSYMDDIKVTFATRD